MQRLKFILCATLLMVPSFSIAQEKKISYTSYLKPAFKGLGAISCFWAAYYTGKLAGVSGQMFCLASDDFKNAETSWGKTSGDLGMRLGLLLFFPSATACVSTSILGGMLAKSAYDDVKKINAKNPKC